MAESTFDVIVVGSGITGMAAAKHLARQGHRTAVIEAMLFGGLIININELHPAPQSEHTSGADFASTLMMEMSDLGVENINETVTAVVLENGFVSVTTDAGRYRARSVILASGAKLKLVGIPGEAEFKDRGVAQCADCDGPMYQGHDVVVVGGGDSALQEALVLADFCKRVNLIHRGTSFSARKDFVDRVAGRDNIHPVWSTVVEEVSGDKAVTKVRVRNVQSGETTEIPCTGFFAYVGLEPNSDFAPAEIARDDRGYVITDASMQTSMKGVYAAGAVRAGYSGLLGDAMAEGEKAASAAGAQLR